MVAAAAQPAWRRLTVLANERGARHVRELLRDTDRYASFTRSFGSWLFDFSRQRVDGDILHALVDLAGTAGLESAIRAMWRGDAINRSENRPALHIALRQPRGANIGGSAIHDLVLEERERMLRFAEQLRGGDWRLVINVGIGGSDLGPAMAVEALRPYGAGAPRVEFVSNVDGCRLADLLAEADPARTLFIIASKTFTTQETMANARAAREWIAERLGEAQLLRHFAAVSVNTAAMNDFGVHPEQRFCMWDWVGGRYSLWSSIGLALAVAIGRDQFESLLAGAHAMDEHFRSAPFADNLPVLAALLGIWNINFLRLPTLAVLPYDDRLRRFPAYLQQLEMESNGKSVSIDGSPLDHETAAVLWGEPGNNAQHSFFQLLHQGSARAALDFVLPVRSSCERQSQQDLAIANCLAQAEAFALGQQDGPAEKQHAGNRPATLLLFDRLDPANLGRLVALYEHKVYAQSVIWGINAFDQWGVELGKRMCGALLSAVAPRGPRADQPERLRKLLDYVDRFRANDGR
ncbi:MAG: glucose-6-phosphate isomerase [Steroidobacteraceae bacterium]